MKTVLCLLLASISFIGCTLDSNSVVSDPKEPPVKALIPIARPTSPIPASVKPPKQLPTVINQTVYFYGSPPEKLPSSFSSIPVANSYFDTLTKKLKQRHGILDANATLAAGTYYLLADNPTEGRSLYTTMFVYSRDQNAVNHGAFENCYIKRLQGFQNFQKPAPGTLATEQVKPYKEYYDLAFQYTIDWNSVMFPACAKRTGDFKKPPDQSPPF